MLNNPTPEEEILAAARVQTFLNDETVRGAIERLERQYYDEFKAASNDEDRRASWAKASVLDDLLLELRAVVSSGERARIEQERRERTSATQRR